MALACAPAGAALAQPAPTPPATRQAALDQLFAALAKAPDEVAATAVAARIRALWAEAASPAVRLLIARGQRNLQADAGSDAVEDFDAALTLQPDFADAWLLRAQALSALGDNAAAARDLQQALALQPKHFGALQLLSRLQEQGGDLAGALRSMQAAMALHPHLPGATARMRDLRRRGLGEDT